MSKSQYKMSKITYASEKMRPPSLIQKLNVYKPFLLIVDINSTNFALVGNGEILGHLFYRQNSPSYTQIKSRLVIYPKCCKLYSEDIAIPLHDWKIENLGAIKLLTKHNSLKTGTLHQIDKTMMLVYMAAFGEDSGVRSKISKPHGKTATWRNQHDLFMQ
ncbi:hypothetical protein BHOIPH791_05330 [Bartonella henselae]|uniref:hypothetical protein n=2 Tax=Bartonella henselae TaxID=38323 RepID=UPI0003DF8A93|nr:hypothetical protein [Bartonella henselae]ETS09184.1 hypothetical protein Q654_00578 [Bartonella henselae JK 50]ETS09341.1 hypothetical protein Q655_00526 [Bartonella henselae JK 51]ETS09769.1 hypothetical protein Q653_00846 [Bartonella henselae JK 42]ETS12797.1 hypothetical protein Q652_00976 [Bartonella henselae JK 41]KEC58552.1 hypothetical protein O97_00450 [Bartonella henselae str. Zeus]KEC61061.1 hypothetical protein O95_00012 [Bartonella henselae JK 53]PNM39316.1 hypothetical prote